MKKVILSALAVVFAFNIASAQEEVVRVTTVTTTNYFKPNQGDVTADLGLFGKGIFSNQSPVNTFNGMLKGRLFLMDDLALRASLSAVKKAKQIHLILLLLQKPAEVVSVYLPVSKNTSTVQPDFRHTLVQTSV